MLKLGVIGYGNRMSYVVPLLLNSGEVTLTCVMDIDNATVKTKYLKDEKFKNVKYYDDADEMLKNEELDGVCIGTRCSSHTEYFLKAFEHKIPVFLEKPDCTTYKDLARIKAALDFSEKVVVSFPLRASPIIEKVKEIIDSGKLGKIEHIQAYNNVTYGRGYYHKWYRDENETGGMFLQKATHDLDYINYLLGDEVKPICLCAMKSKQIFKGDKPAGLKCVDCADAKSCPESPENVTKAGDTGTKGEYCCFAVDTGNEDSGSVIIRYNSGMHVVYSQNFFVRNGASRRGARLVGYKGTLEFDWYKNEITVYHHDINDVESYSLDNPNGVHFGGDNVLCDNFIEVMKGGNSKTPLLSGIKSVELCLAARKSSTENIFVDIHF
jgi:predicted dehydrogenase